MSQPREAASAPPAAPVRLKRAEAQFETREILHRDLLNALPAAIYTTDAQGRITFYNDAAVAMAGRRPVLGSDEWCVTWRLYWLDGRPMAHDECPMAVALREGREIRGAEAIAERPDGSRVTFTPYPTLLRDARGRIVGAVNMLVDITERKAAEERERLLANEVNHRANNLLTVVQAMLRVTEGASVAQFKSALSGRIEALAHAHSLLAKSRWVSADLQHLIGEEMAPYVGGERPRVWMSGPALPLEASAAQSMAMIVHEMAVNAVKYGALSSAEGEVLIEWGVCDGAAALRWTETGGPKVEAPLRRGVGSAVLERSCAQVGGKLTFDWRPEGLVADFIAAADRLLAAPPAVL